MASGSERPWNLDKLTTRELLELSRRVLAELRRREVIRSGNAPAGDYAELVVKLATGGELAPNSQKSWDVMTPEGDRLQVKARVVTDPTNAGQRQLSTFRSWEFDFTLIVLFDDDFRVWKAAKLESKVMREQARPDPHVGGFRLLATDSLLARGEDWTTYLRDVQD
jgi:hypothetical protein